MERGFRGHMSRFWVAVATIGLTLAMTGDVGLAQSENKDDDFLLEDKGHLKIERPAKLSKEDAEKLLDHHKMIKSNK